MFDRNKLNRYGWIFCGLKGFAECRREAPGEAVERLHWLLPGDQGDGFQIIRLLLAPDFSQLVGAPATRGIFRWSQFAGRRE